MTFTDADVHLKGQILSDPADFTFQSDLSWLLKKSRGWWVGETSLCCSETMALGILEERHMGTADVDANLVVFISRLHSGLFAMMGIIRGVSGGGLHARTCNGMQVWISPTS